MRTKCVHLFYDSSVKKFNKKRQKMTKSNLKVVKSTKDQEVDNKEKISIRCCDSSNYR